MLSVEEIREVTGTHVAPDPVLSLVLILGFVEFLDTSLPILSCPDVHPVPCPSSLSSLAVPKFL